MINVRFSKCNKDAKIPEYKTQGSAGADLYSVEDIILVPHKVTLVPTGLKMSLPNERYEIQIRSRSGMALKGIMVANAPGTIDSDYRGEIKILLMNLNDEPFQVEKGMRIAQMVISVVEQACFIESKALDDTIRGEGGFGSTGDKE